ncbi:hypothetical protein IWQ57_001036 [Coemansia nantahalensis]|uniref:Uncharacterized protein n=1 Tax=Coemansia nantahalensis TaxID=2789366 RepID=A0ACC1K6F5_9FUNG|nr:hypothetical protein IWQ57_001036 [Coemansia nantahalensis]
MGSEPVARIVRARADGSAQAARARRLLAAGAFGALALAESKRLARAHTAAVHSLAVDAAHGRFLLSAGADTSVQLYDLEAGSSARQIEPVQRIPAGAGHSRIVSSVAWYPVDSGLFTTASFDGTLRVWDAATMAEACQFDLECRVHCQAMSPTGAHALVAAASESAHIRLGDLRTGAFAQTLPIHRSGGTAVAWSPVSPYILASGTAAGGLKLWDIRQAGGHLHAFGDGADAHPAGVCGLLFAADGRRLVSSGADAGVRFWGVDAPHSLLTDVPSDRESMSRRYGAAGRCELAIAAAPGDEAGAGVVFCPNGDTTVSAIDIASGRRLAALDGHFAPTLCAAWRPGHAELYTGGADSNVLVWCASARAAPSEDATGLLVDTWSESESDGAP